MWFPALTQCSSKYPHKSFPTSTINLLWAFFSCHLWFCLCCRYFCSYTDTCASFALCCVCLYKSYKTLTRNQRGRCDELMKGIYSGCKRGPGANQTESNLIKMFDDVYELYLSVLAFTALWSEAKSFVWEGLGLGLIRPRNSQFGELSMCRVMFSSESFPQG